MAIHETLARVPDDARMLLLCDCQGAIARHRERVARRKLGAPPSEPDLQLSTSARAA